MSTGLNGVLVTENARTSTECAVQGMLTHFCSDSVPLSPRVLRVPAEEGQVRPVRSSLTSQTLTQSSQMQSLARGEPPRPARQVLFGECVSFPLRRFPSARRAHD